ANPVTSLCASEKISKLLDSSAAKPGARPCIPRSRLACLSLRHSGSPPEAAADAADAEDALPVANPSSFMPAEQPPIAASRSLVIDQLAIVASSKSACGILDLSLKAAGRCGVADVPEAAAAAAGQAPKAAAAEDAIAKPQRQNFTDVQNSQLQGWFSEHRQKPYPQHRGHAPAGRAHRA
uniref:Homeobox_KN domain-containing protein n=1 Tax=Macrostomum lignano TaxID=282301 RepID=A0A1I8FRL9_9PLAT